jgi:hypothetical protein
MCLKQFGMVTTLARAYNAPNTVEAQHGVSKCRCYFVGGRNCDDVVRKKLIFVRIM